MNANGNGQPEDQHLLSLLDAVEKQADVSQRSLSKQMGVALGLTNSYLKRCIRKGWIKISSAPANRYLYYITPKGFAEKSRLTRQYLSYSLSFYREAADSCQRLFSGRRGDPVGGTVVFVGKSDLAEIASIRALESGLEILGTYDPDSNSTQFLGKPVWNDHSNRPNADYYVVTGLDSAEALYKDLLDIVEPEKILVPDILAISKVKTV